MSLSDPIPNAANFTLSELIKSTTAIQKGIDNTPPPQHQQNLIKLAVNILQPLRDAFGPIRVHSGYRCTQLNKLVGGSKNSHHMTGCACDLEPISPDVSLADAACFIAKNLDFHELILEHLPDGWIHVAFVDGVNSKNIKICNTANQYSSATVESICP